ncbi:MAG: S9 family peptidase [Dokdonella sp.]|uniref:alpha/beta hydrolase family protein n=1 Tax=Dokdonella sp. TaxID=2291710 RepID=UPI0025C5C917|nr:S9 family peptidase [Dokdonella sp.]MBX3700533.1 S9 family peptidase [Dokdonella sp.]MCW5578623.1 S9 family peptidase [Dokdonella sp.]
MSSRLSIALCAILLASPVLATPAEHAPRVLTGDDLFNLEAASDPQIAPDGKRVVYVRQSNDIMHDRARSTLWLIDVASGVQTPLVAGAGSHVQPRWSPDGTRLAYLSSDGDGPGMQLYVRWMNTGASARITSLPYAPRGIAWSPDGTRIAWSMFVPDEGAQLGKAPLKPPGAQWAEPLQVIDKIVYRTDEGGYAKPGYVQIFWTSADGGAPIQLTFGAHNAGGQIAWSHDGREVLFSANLEPDWERNIAESEIHAVALDTHAVRTLTHRRGPDRAPVVSPDGQSIAYVGFDDRYLGYQNEQLSLMRADGSQSRVLTAKLDRSVADPRWAADGRALFVTYGEGGGTRLARVGLDGSLRTLADNLVGDEFDRPYSGGQFSSARDGSIAYTGGDAQHPADVWLVRDGKPRQLTRLNRALLGARTLGKVTPLAVSAFDGLPIDAWLVTPPDFVAGRKYPLILEIHGGPYAAYGPAFSTDYQLYAAAGYAVVYANPRGSTGYGQAFADQIDKNYPSHDYDDLMSVVDAAIATGSVDRDNLFVTGGSGGGVLTAWIVGKTDRFRAAVSQKPVINWTSFVLTSDMTPYFARYWFGKYPWEDITSYWAHSPLSLVGNVKTPTLVIVGGEDHRTPVSESEQYYEALQLRGVPTALIKVPGANHGGLAERPSQSAAKTAAILAWFERYRSAANR